MYRYLVSFRPTNFLCALLGAWLAVFVAANAQSNNASLPTRFPLVFHHGFNAAPGSRQSFHVDLLVSLRSRGAVIYTSAVSPFNSVANRAAQLGRQLDQILAESGADKVNLIAHSMGGLDARFAISSLGYADRVATLTTISTPHLGTLLADAVLAPSQWFSRDALDALGHLIGESYAADAFASNVNVHASLHDLSTTHASTFNRENPDHPMVFYQSWAGLSNVLGIAGPHDAQACRDAAGTLSVAPQAPRDKMSAKFVPGVWFVSDGTDLLPNDGLVTVASARWGLFRGCVTADHLDLVAQNPPYPNSRTGFDPFSFYAAIVGDLKRRGY